jgi:hypothetical protein
MFPGRRTANAPPSTATAKRPPITPRASHRPPAAPAPPPRAPRPPHSALSHAARSSALPASRYRLSPSSISTSRITSSLTAWSSATAPTWPRRPSLLCANDPDSVPPTAGTMSRATAPTEQEMTATEFTMPSHVRNGTACAPKRSAATDRVRHTGASWRARAGRLTMRRHGRILGWDIHIRSPAPNR